MSMAHGPSSANKPKCPRAGENRKCLRNFMFSRLLEINFSTDCKPEFLDFRIKIREIAQITPAARMGGTQKFVDSEFLDSKLLDSKFFDSKFLDSKFLDIKFLDSKFHDSKFLDSKFLNSKFLDSKFHSTKTNSLFSTSRELFFYVNK
jgi:hypothetical protein